MHYIDPHIHMISRTTDDYQRMAFAQCAAVSEPAFWAGFDRGSARAFHDYFRQLTEYEPKRAAQFNIKHYCWLCINAKEAENVSLSREVISLIPEFQKMPNVLGIGEIGLNKNTTNEATIFQEHMDLAMKTNELILIHTPHLEDKYKGTRMIVDMLKGDKRIKPQRVCIDHVEEHTVRIALDNGFWCGMTLYPTTKCTPARAVDIIEMVGTERIMANSAGDWGKSDPLAVPELIQEMKRRGHPESDIKKVVYDNPLSFWRQANNWKDWPPEPSLNGQATPAKAGAYAKAMLFLAIETSCDETSAAVFTDEPRVLSNVVASQTELHTPFGGVVPEIAARAHLQKILPVVEEALQRAGVKLNDIGCIAVHNTPGLVGALLIGVSFAKMLSLALDVPLIAVNHVASHIYACRLAAERDIFPCVGMVVSGGHTAVFECEDALKMTLLGSTRDDAAGEAFDKVAAILGLGFPGGPAVEREAASGDRSKYKFPRAFLHEDRIEFSFSGLKTAVLYTVNGQNAAKAEPPPAGQFRADVAASFQLAVVDVLVAKCKLALTKTGLNRLAVGGGVIANQALRGALAAMCNSIGAELVIPPMSLCTDNAAMAALAVEKWKRGEFAALDLDAEPNFI